MKQMIHWVVAAACLLTGAVLLALGPIEQYWYNRSLPRVSATTFREPAASQPAPAVISGRPVRLAIPALGIDLPVIDGYYNQTTKKWTLTNDKVQYAVITPLANNQQGNTFLYGHNRRGVFRTLNKVHAGDQAIVTTDNGHTFTYRFVGALETTPTDDSLFHYQGKPILTIQTCSGAWYQNRQLFRFDLEAAQ